MFCQVYTVFKEAFVNPHEKYKERILHGRTQ